MDQPETAPVVAEDIQPPSIARSPTDHFLHPSLLRDSSLLFRARVLIASQYAVIAGSAISIALVTIAPAPAILREVGIPVCAAFITLFTILLFKLKRDGGYKICSTLTVWFIVIPIVLGIFITGGMSASPVAHLLMGPPLLMAFFFGGVRMGGILTAVVAVLVAVGLLAEQLGAHPVQVFASGQEGVVNSMFVMDGIATNAILAFLYEYLSGALRRARDEEHQKIVRLAQTDSLTGLTNRRAFDDALGERIALYDSGQKARPFALCFLDLNGFKPINDRHGHDVGDQVLRAISIRLRSSLRGADLIGRQGGDEFMLLLDELESGPLLEALANRYLKIIREPIETSAGLLSVTGSLGFALFPNHGEDAASLRARADAAMYEAKRGNKGWCLSDVN